MKKIFLIVAICFVTKTSIAQLNTTLVMVQTPPGTLIDWDMKTLTYLVSNAVGAVFKALIKTEIRTMDGTIVATTNLAKARVLNIGGSNMVFYPADVLPLDVMIFNGKYKSSLEKTGKLPADNYVICVQLVNASDYRILSEQRCRNFTMAAFQMPIPTMPYHESVLDLERSQSVITFRWTPVSPKPAEILIYRVTVFEILDHQTPMQALRSNQPLLAKDVTGTTQYIWQPQLGMTPCCRDMGVEMKTDTSKRTGPGPDMEPDAYAFIWTIQTFDQAGKPFGDGDVNGDGISEPIMFFVDRRPAAMRREGPPARALELINGKKKTN